MEIIKVKFSILILKMFLNCNGGSGSHKIEADADALGVLKLFYGLKEILNKI